MSQALVPASSAAVATSSWINAVQGQTEMLERLANEMPDACEAVVEVVVASSRHSGRQTVTEFYHAGTLSIDFATGDVDASIAEYMKQRMAEAAAASSGSRALQGLEGKLCCVPLNKEIKDLCEVAGRQASDRQVTNAVKIAKFVSAAFAKGFELPASGFDYSMFTIRLFDRNAGKPGEGGMVETLHFWKQSDGQFGTDIQCTPATQSSGGQRIPSLLKVKFNDARAFAINGYGRPAEVPADFVCNGSVTYTGNVPALRNGEESATPAIEDLTGGAAAGAAPALEDRFSSSSAAAAAAAGPASGLEIEVLED